MWNILQDKIMDMILYLDISLNVKYSNYIDPLFFNKPDYNGPTPTLKQKMIAYVSAPFVRLVHHLGIHAVWGYLIGIFLFVHFFLLIYTVFAKINYWKAVKGFFKEFWWFWALFLALCIVLQIADK